MAEWFKARAWKARVPKQYRGFESPSLRQLFHCKSSRNHRPLEGRGQRDAFAGGRRFAGGRDYFQDVQGVFGSDEEFAAGGETFGSEGRALLPDVALRVLHVAFEVW